jgi:hypothetical protein
MVSAPPLPPKFQPIRRLLASPKVQILKKVASFVGNLLRGQISITWKF